MAVEQQSGDDAVTGTANRRCEETMLTTKQPLTADVGANAGSCVEQLPIISSILLCVLHACLLQPLAWQ